MDVKRPQLIRKTIVLASGKLANIEYEAEPLFEENYLFLPFGVVFWTRKQNNKYTCGMYRA